MPERDEPTPDSDSSELRELERRLEERRSERLARAGRKPHAPMGALGMAWRMSIEMAAAVFVGGGLGYGLDRLFGSAPWIMVAGLFLGFAAGVRNAVRAAYAMQAPAPGAETQDGRERD